MLLALGLGVVGVQPVRAQGQELPVLSTVTGVVDLGFGAELLPGGWARGMMVGLRLGYLAAPSGADWDLFDNAVSGGPAASIGGPYIRGLIGIGWRR